MKTNNEPWLDHMERIGKMNPRVREFAEHCARIHDLTINYGPANGHTVDAWVSLRLWLRTTVAMEDSRFDLHMARIGAVYTRTLMAIRDNKPHGPRSRESKHRSRAWRMLIDDVFEVKR